MIENAPSNSKPELDGHLPLDSVPIDLSVDEQLRCPADRGESEMVSTVSESPAARDSDGRRERKLTSREKRMKKILEEKNQRSITIYEVIGSPSEHGES